MNRKHRIQRIGIASAVKIGAVISSAIGFFLGIIWGFSMVFFSAIIGTMLTGETAGFGYAAILFFPLLFAILYGCIGTIVSFLFALVYNLTAGLIGGIELEIEEEDKAEYPDSYYG